MSRVDFFVRNSDGAVLPNEINTIPGQTPISMYHKLFEEAGVPYKELIDRLIGSALSRGGEVEVVVFAAVFEFPQSLADSFLGERADPQAH